MTPPKATPKIIATLEKTLNLAIAQKASGRSVRKGLWDPDGYSICLEGLLAKAQGLYFEAPTTTSSANKQSATLLRFSRGCGAYQYLLAVAQSPCYEYPRLFHFNDRWGNDDEADREVQALLHKAIKKAREELFIAALLPPGVGVSGCPPAKERSEPPTFPSLVGCDS